MVEIIEFPKSEIRLENEFKSILDSIEYTSAELKECVEKSVIPVLVRYSKIPEHSFSLELPTLQTAEELDIFFRKIQNEIKTYAVKIQLNMMREIIMLHVNLCECQLHKGDS